MGDVGSWTPQKFKKRLNTLTISVIGGLVANFLPEFVRKYVSIASLSIGLFVLGIGLGLITTYWIFSPRYQSDSSGPEQAVITENSESDSENQTTLPVAASNSSLRVKVRRSIFASPPETSLIPVAQTNSSAKVMTIWIRLIGLLIISVAGGTVGYLIRPMIYTSLIGGVVGIIIGTIFLNGATRFMIEQIESKGQQ